MCKNNSEVKIKITFLLSYIIKLTRVDFHFDFIKDDIILLNSMEFKDKKTNEVSYISYSKDGKKIHQSHWIAYNRKNRLIKVNQIKKEEIANMERIYRIEYRLKSKNNKYLNLINLRGNFLLVFWLFKDVIARSWRDRGYEIANVKTNPFRNPFFNVILQEAESGNIIKNNPALKRKEKIERDNLSYYVYQDKPNAKEPMLIDLTHTLKGND